MSIRTISFDASYLAVREGVDFLSDALTWYGARKRRPDAAPAIDSAILRELTAFTREGESTYMRPELLGAAEHIVSLAFFNGPRSFQNRFHELSTRLHRTSLTPAPLRFPASPSPSPVDLAHVSDHIAALSSPRRYAHHGLTFNYFIAREAQLPASIIKSDSLFIATPRALMIIGDRFDALPEASRATMIAYVAAFGYGAHLSGNVNYGIALMGALAERDGRLHELMGVLATLAPRHMASFIAPHMSAAAHAATTSNATQIAAANELVHSFAWPDDVVAAYRPFALTHAGSHTQLQPAGIFAEAARQVIRAYFHPARYEAARALIRGKNSSAIRALMDGAVDAAEKELVPFMHAAALHVTRWRAHGGLPRTMHDAFLHQLEMNLARELDRADAATEQLLTMTHGTGRSSPVTEPPRYMDQRQQLLDGIATMIDDHVRYAAFCRTHIDPLWKWKHIKKLPAQRRPLVQFVRQQTLTLFGGTPPRKSPLTGATLSGPPMDRLLSGGISIFNCKFTQLQLKEHLSELFSLSRTNDGSFVAAPLPLSFMSAYEQYIESVLKQVPLARIPAPARPLVHIVRTRLCHRFGGALPNFSPVNGKNLSTNVLHEIARAGIARLSHSYTAADLRDDCEIQLGLTFAPVIPPDDLQELPYTFKSAYEHFITHRNGWTALDNIADYDRALIAGARAHLFHVLGGWMPQRMPIPPKVCFGDALVGDWIAHGGTGLDLKMRLHLYEFLTRHLFSLERSAPGDYVRIAPAPAHMAIANAWFAHYPTSSVTPVPLPALTRTLPR